MNDLAFFRAKFDIYPESVNPLERDSCFLINQGDRDQLCITGHNPAYPGTPYFQSGYKYTLSELNHAAADFLRKNFPFCAPVPILSRKASLGVGDRLGLAGPGHLRVFQEYNIFPILAQQSMRELTLTNRCMSDVIDSATFSAFRAGYREGFGADGDHLKTMEEIRDALECGCTMITLDCCNYIDNNAALLPDSEIEYQYQISETLKRRYLSHPFELGPDLMLTYDAASLRRLVAIYEKAIDFIDRVYFGCITSQRREIGFEISIDETLTVTSPLAHHFVAYELKIRGIRFDTIAPRFSGEFQKGIDYIGDLNTLREELHAHNAIARFFGYKLSIHSGSDKFSIFPMIGEETDGYFHLKTSGTSWLEALRVIARCDPAMFREMYDIAWNAFEDNCRFYHVTPDLTSIPNVSAISDENLPMLLDMEASRQFLHIGYGSILDNKGLKERLYDALWHNRQAYSDALYYHIGHHVQSLGILPVATLKTDSSEA